MSKQPNVPDEEIIDGEHEDDYEVKCRMAKVKSKGMPAPNEEQVIEKMRSWLLLYPTPKGNWTQAALSDFYGTMARKFIAELKRFGYRSPSEIRELERAAMERVISDFQDALGTIIRFINTEKKTALQNKDKANALIITVRDMIHDTVVALKSELLEGK